MTNWYKAYTITQVMLILLLLIMGGYAYVQLKNRIYIFEHPLNYVIQSYELQSCSCNMNDGGLFSFWEGNVSILKPIEENKPSNFSGRLNLDELR